MTPQIQEELYHRIGSMLPTDEEEQQFLQIFFMPDEQALRKRQDLYGNHVREPIISELQTLVMRTIKWF